MSLIFDGAAFSERLKQEAAIGVFRDALKAGRDALSEQFDQGEPITQLIASHTSLIDELLGRAWAEYFNTDAEDIALVAVGGYGRGELHPSSDIDLLLLMTEDLGEQYRESIEGFLTFLWDIGLEVGQSVRSLDDCRNEAMADITIATNLLEARLLHGPQTLFDEMRERTSPEHIWSSREFFEAKLTEQQERHLRHHDTASNLEPNIKEGPGGLRDIQMIGWVAKRHFGEETIFDLVNHDFLTRSEYNALMAGQTFLWRIRYALHLLTGRREDRLLFDHQRSVAEQFGYRDNQHNLGVERFMQDYYRTVKELSRLNEMLLQHFQEAILLSDTPCHVVPVNRRFQTVNGYLEATNAGIFARYPTAILEAFLLVQQHPEIMGVRASTIRLIRAHLHMIDRRFRDDLANRTLFLEIFRQPQGLTHALRRMNRYGVLAAYLPVFGRIVGRMQYDLFHAYTVDEHTMFVIRNLRRMAMNKHAEELPFCHQIMQTLPKPHLLYLAGMFHDIAKGRGGDHSELGEVDTLNFCRHHGLPEYDARLVAWLVRHHLDMSTTAQRKDISDPQVIHDFAELVGDPNHLKYLYLLTVADVRGTNPSLWNSWKDSLLRTLYKDTLRVLRRGLNRPVDYEAMVAETKAKSRHLLQTSPVFQAEVDAVWSRLGDEYFLRYSSDEIAWHTSAIVNAGENELPLVLVRSQGFQSSTSTAVFIYTDNAPNLFARTTSMLDRLGLSVNDARIVTSSDDMTLNTFIVMEADGEPLADNGRSEEIVDALKLHLNDADAEPVSVNRRAPRQYKHFPIPTQTEYDQDERNERTILEVITADRPGLLSSIGQVFMQHEVQVQNARIATFGNQAEDVFFISDLDGKPIDDEQQLITISNALKAQLDEDAPPQAVGS